MAHNEVVSAPHFGLAKHAMFAGFNYADPPDSWMGVIHAGAVFECFGDLFMCIRNRAGGNLVIGESVSLLISDATRTGNLATGTTAALLLTDDTHDTKLTAGFEPLPSYVTVTAGALATTPTMQRRALLENTPATSASTLRVARVDGYGSGGQLETDLTSVDIITGTVDNTYDYTVWERAGVVKSDSDALATQMVQGVVKSAVVTDNYLGLIQITGMAMALVNGTTDCPVGTLLVASATAGELIKWDITDANATTIGAEILNAGMIAARIMDSYTDGNPGLRMVQLLNRPLINYPILGGTP